MADTYSDKWLCTDPDPCEPGEHEHDEANYTTERVGNLVMGTCKLCRREFIIEELEEESV